MPPTTNTGVNNRINIPYNGGTSAVSSFSVPIHVVFDGTQAASVLSEKRERKPQTERRFFPAEELRVIDSGGGKQISWFPALFHSESEEMWGFRETIKPSAFNKTVQEADVRALFNHDPNYVLGRNTAGTLDLSVTRKGLRAVVNPPDAQWASDLMASIERGDITGGSFGFQVVKDEWTFKDDGSAIRELQEVRLFDVSIVTYPAYPETNGSVALRALLDANGIDETQLTRALAKRQAGQPLDDEEQAEIALLDPEPEPVVHEMDEHSVRTRELWRQRLRVLELTTKRRH